MKPTDQSNLYVPNPDDKEPYAKLFLELMFSETLYQDIKPIDLVIYSLIRNRVGLSFKQENRARYSDSNSNVFCEYTQEDLSRHTRTARQTVKDSLQRLEQNNLIIRDTVSMPVTRGKGYKTITKYYVLDIQYSELKPDCPVVGQNIANYNTPVGQNIANYDAPVGQNLDSIRTNKDIRTNKEQKQDITAKAGDGDDVLFEIKRKRLTKEEFKSLSKAKQSEYNIGLAKDTSDWSGVRTTDLLHYLKVVHDKHFPIPLALDPVSGYEAKILKESFLDRYKIETSEACAKIEQLVLEYRSSPDVGPEYKDKFTVRTLQLDWLMDKIMDSIGAKERAALRPKHKRFDREQEAEASVDDDEVF